MSARKTIGRAAEFSRAELGYMVSMVAGLLDDHIDMIFITAADDGFLTTEAISRLCETQKFAQHLHEAFAPKAEGGAA